MAKESMKAREVKRAKLIAKYAAKREQFLTEGNYDALQTLQETLRLYATTTVVKSPVVRKGICVSSVFPVSSSAKWLQKG